MRMPIWLVVGLIVAAAAGPSAGTQVNLPGWFDSVEVSARPDPPGRAVDLRPEGELRAAARKALQDLKSADPDVRQEACYRLRETGRAILLPEAIARLQQVAKNDPYRERQVISKDGRTAMVATVRAEAGAALVTIRERMALEQWLAGRPAASRASQVVSLLTGRGPGWRYSGKPAGDEVLVCWLCRHPRESLPHLLSIGSGTPFVASNGRIPTVGTPNCAARLAAVQVIGTNRVKAAAKHLLGMLTDPTCYVQRRSQAASFSHGGVVDPSQLVRSYPVRDAAAGALQALGYRVTFDGRQYHAVPPGKSGKPARRGR